MSDPSSRRLDLTPLTLEALDALIVGDRQALEAATGATFPEPLAAPPLMDDALPHFRDVLRVDASVAPWWARLLIVRETGAAAGSAGFTGPPDSRGTVTLGYSVYPEQQCRGLASEAATALVTWALAQPGVRRVQATIPPGHTASRRVAEKAGMRRIGTIETDDGLVDLWERGGA